MNPVQNNQSLVEFQSLNNAINSLGKLQRFHDDSATHNDYNNHATPSVN